MKSLDRSSYGRSRTDNGQSNLAALRDSYFVCWQSTQAAMNHSITFRIPVQVKLSLSQANVFLTLSLFLSPFPSSLHHFPFFHLQIWCLVVWWRLWRVSEVVGRGVWPVVLCFVKDIFSAQVVQCILIMKFRKLCVLRYMFYKVTNICFLQVTTMAFFGRIGNLLRQTASRQVSS